MTLSTPAELQARYDALTTRIGALDVDISRELDTERRTLLQSRRDEMAKEREAIAGDMMLLGVTPQKHAPIEHRVLTLEREVTWIKGVLKPGARQLLARVLFYGLLIIAWSMWMVKEIRDWLLLHPMQAVLITIALVCAALIIRWLPEDSDHV